MPREDRASRREFGTETSGPDQAFEGNKPQLVTEFETRIGVQLFKLPEGKSHPGYPKWPWSWTPQQAAYFVGEWKDAVLMLVPLLHDLAMTPPPSRTVEGDWVAGNRPLYELACQDPIRQAIDRAEDVTEAAWGQRTPYPHGEVMVDLRCRIPGFRSDVYTINDHSFWGTVKVNEDTARQLRYMHGNCEAEKLRTMQGFDHMVDLGAVRA